ncbi:MAG: hypothetical protein ABIO92_07105 [Chloroflexia bacterium]
MHIWVHQSSYSLHPLGVLVPMIAVGLGQRLILAHTPYRVLNDYAPFGEYAPVWGAA